MSVTVVVRSGLPYGYRTIVMPQGRHITALHAIRQKRYPLLLRMTHSTPPPNRRLVVCTVEGQYGLMGIETRTEFPSELQGDTSIARLIRVTDRYVLYREMPHVASTT